ncbi:MAG: hypothetical protein HS127_01065 [Planctomycetia bacterium]|uniref:hypothetical protein n=1 Tax=Candidatus Kuenenia sp. TaxID=2499824 RepID=UPI001DADB734|nr:hypothetical protein [Planctomycetia bacterium]
MATENIPYKIPENEATVFYPPIGDAPELTRDNMREIQHYAFKITDIPFQTLRNETRLDLLNIATQYTKKIFSFLPHKFSETTCHTVNDSGKNAAEQLYESFLPAEPIISHRYCPESIPIILTGHEPIFYHPGIWIKNHLAYYLAEKLKGISINLIVDSDSCKADFVYVPCFSEESASIQKVSFVEGRETQAYEEISLERIEVIERFKDKVDALLRKNNHDDVKNTVKGMQIMFDCFMYQIRHAYQQGCKDMTGLFTAARKGMENAFGIKNLEIPVSLMCNTKGFYSFFLHILYNAKQFAEIHNEKLKDYRNTQAISSKANPVPDLEIHDTLVELPFWIWEKGGARNKCYARYDGGSIIVTNGNQMELALKKDEDPQKIISRLRSLESYPLHPIKLRPRAITLTMFSRLFLSDVFIHGIGGSKYDVITNAIMKDFFHINPPKYITTTTTLFLPVKTQDIDVKTLPVLQKELNDMRTNPERHASEKTRQNPLFLKMVEGKRALIEKMRGSDKEKRSQLFHQIKELNASMFKRITNEFGNRQRKLAAVKEKMACNEVAKCREYPIGIFPFNTLHDHFANVFSESKNKDKQS